MTNYTSKHNSQLPQILPRTFFFFFNKFRDKIKLMPVWLATKSGAGECLALFQTHQPKTLQVTYSAMKTSKVSKRTFTASHQWVEAAKRGTVPRHGPRSCPLPRGDPRPHSSRTAPGLGSPAPHWPPRLRPTAPSGPEGRAAPLTSWCRC